MAREHILYRKRTHFVAREHILWKENTFYSLRTHSLTGTHTHTHTHTHTYAHTHTHTQTHTHRMAPLVQAELRLSPSLNIYVCMHACMYTDIHIYMYICVCVCVCVFIYIYMYLLSPFPRSRRERHTHRERLLGTSVHSGGRGESPVSRGHSFSLTRPAMTLRPSLPFTSLFQPICSIVYL